jgi:hypothetical protein
MTSHQNLQALLNWNKLNEKTFRDRDWYTICTHSIHNQSLNLVKIKLCKNNYW